jgi:hypothetical protein
MIQMTHLATPPDARVLNCAVIPPVYAAEPLLQIVLGVDPNGRATQPWREMIARRLSKDKFRALACFFVNSLR